MLKLRTLFIIAIALLTLTNCKFSATNNVAPAAPKYKTKNAIIIVMDGARYSETLGDSSKHYIPFLTQLIAPNGIIDNSFYNDGPTYTNAGHSALCTGYYQEISNDGTEFPSHPSLFQYMNRQLNTKQSLSWVVASKDKLSILANCSNPNWKGTFLPSFNCGTDGSGTGCGYRSDSLTCVKAKEILANEHPRLMLINFAEIDGAGHSKIWGDYLHAISTTDTYVYDIWKFLQTDKNYKSSTAVFITSDHGRHSDGVLDGFCNHGCPCDGCRHVLFVATGPDFKKNAVISKHYDLRDIPATIGELMGFPFPSDGEVMKEILH